MKNIFSKVLYVLIAIMVGVTVTYAGSLVPPGSPEKTMKTLGDLYTLVDTGEDTPSTDFDTPGSVSATMNSIGDIYDLLADKIEDIDPDTILTGTTIFGVEGEAEGETPAPTFASADSTQYKCEWLTTDPTQPGVTLETICGYHTDDGCSWTGSVCSGDDTLKTPVDGYMTWYAGKAACANSTEDEQTAGSWRLPTYLELGRHYLDNNIDGGSPAGFQGYYYWSDTTHPAYSGNAYYVYMNDLNMYNDFKDLPNDLVRCAR